MNMKSIWIAAAGIVASLQTVGANRAAEACTRIFWNTNAKATVSARTMDLFMDDKPRLVYMPRGLKHTGAADPSAAHWSSKYSSVVVTSLDVGVVDGLNEHGLGAHLLYLHGTKYEPSNGRPVISNLIWSQYVLDNFTTVAEALDGLKQVRVVSKMAVGQEWPLHLALEDETGDSAIIEYVDGHIKIHHGKEFTVMTNEPSMDQQLANLKRYKLFGGDLSMPGDIDPISRFVRASSYLKTLPAPADDREALGHLTEVIRNVAVPFGAVNTSGSEAADTWPTRWATLIDLSQKRYFFFPVHGPNVFWVDLEKLNQKSSSLLAIDPNSAMLSGDITSQMKKLIPPRNGSTSTKMEYPPPL